MAKFLSSFELNSELEKLFRTAKTKLILISPFIKLNAHYKGALEQLKQKPKIHIILVFGKNEFDKHKSLGFDDLTFLKDFPNIEIRYESRLHAKYYANDKASILSSMNLHNASHDKNIEAGIAMKSNFFIQLLIYLTNKVLPPEFENDELIYYQLSKFFKEVIDASKIIYKKVPEFNNNILPFNKKYVSCKETINLLSDFFSHENITQIDHSERTNEMAGYCINTRDRIPFDLKRPFRFDIWFNLKKSGDIKQKQNYCHFSGEDSHSLTSIDNPVLEKYREIAETKITQFKNKSVS